MTDLETRLVDTLGHQADAAPEATGLAGRARTRARRRRRTRGGLAVAGALVVAVPVVVTVAGGSDKAPDRAPVAVDPTPSATVPDGWRVVRWGDLEVAAPGTWSYGRRSSWCAADGSAREGRIERPGEGGRDVGCSNPEQSYGLTFGSSATIWPSYRSGDVERYDTRLRSMPVTQEYVDGSWLGWWYDADRMVSVNAADRETVEQILATVRRVP